MGRRPITADFRKDFTMASSRSQRNNCGKRRVRTRKRRNLDKFVPSGDSDFAHVSRDFANYLLAHVEQCNVAAQDAEELSELVEQFRKALSEATARSLGTKRKTDIKNTARKAAEQKMRALGAKIRTDPNVEWKHKNALRVVGLPKRRKSSVCPQQPPRLLFENSGKGADGEFGLGNGSGVHVLKFRAEQEGTGLTSSSRPNGATRLELFVGFIPQGGALAYTPQEYQQMGYGWPVYLRSYATSPIEARFPMPSEPMLIVYWARWANNKGDHGRFCQTCFARVEGWSKGTANLPEHTQATVQHGAQHALPAAAPFMHAQRTQTTFLLVGTPLALPDSDDAHEQALPQVSQVRGNLLPNGAQQKAA
jgi:hypothetical protein